MHWDPSLVADATDFFGWTDTFVAKRTTDTVLHNRATFIATYQVWL